MQDIKAGDHVFHEPSGETWVVAHVSNNMLAWCGWPAGMTKLEDCKLVKSCTHDEHVDMLIELAGMQDDFRGEHARRTLKQMGRLS